MRLASGFPLLPIISFSVFVLNLFWSYKMTWEVFPFSRFLEACASVDLLVLLKSWPPRGLMQKAMSPGKQQGLLLPR